MKSIKVVFKKSRKKSIMSYHGCKNKSCQTQKCKPSHLDYKLGSELIFLFYSFQGSRWSQYAVLQTWILVKYQSPSGFYKQMWHYLIKVLSSVYHFQEYFYCHNQLFHLKALQLLGTENNLYLSYRITHNLDTFLYVFTHFHPVPEISRMCKGTFNLLNTILLYYIKKKKIKRNCCDWD